MRILVVFGLLLFTGKLVAQQDSSQYNPQHTHEIFLKTNPLVVTSLGGNWLGVSPQLMYKKVVKKQAYRFSVNVSHPQGNGYGVEHLKLKNTDTSVVYREFKDVSYEAWIGIGYERRIYKKWGGWYYGGDIYGGFAEIRQLYFDVEYAYSPYENTSSSKNNPSIYAFSEGSKQVIANQFLGGIQGIGGIFYDINKRLTLAFETGIRIGVKTGKSVYINKNNELEITKRTVSVIDLNTNAFIGQGNLSIVYKFGGRTKSNT